MCHCCQNSRIPLISKLWTSGLIDVKKCLMGTRICAMTNDVFANDIKTSQKWGGKYNKRESIEQNRNQLAVFSDSWYSIRKIASRTSVFCCDRFSGERRQARGTKCHFIALLSSSKQFRYHRKFWQHSSYPHYSLH